MSVSELVHQFASQFHAEVVSHYRYLHQHPELSFQEENTANYVASFLKKEGISHKTHIGGYGILAWIDGTAVTPTKLSRTVALVADMDALPVHEANDVLFKSCVEGVMHACGHDSHTAALMGAVKITKELSNTFCGRILFVFQPGEERSPGGADLMLKDGLFDNDNPELIVKQHAYIDLPAGDIAFQTGTVMASADEVHIKVRGQGGHGALPHELNDTVLAASNIIIALQQIVSRRRNPFEPMTLSFGKFIADGATNVIPSELVMAGSLRCMNEDERQKMLGIIPNVITSTAEAYGCTAEVNMPDGYPCTVSHPEQTEMVKQSAITLLGEAHVTEYPKRMTAEDFGFYTQHYPCCFYRFGVSSPHAKCGKLHSPTFLIDESSLLTASAMLAFSGIDYLKI